MKHRLLAGAAILCLVMLTGIESARAETTAATERARADGVEPGQPLPVVASFSILSDWIQLIGGERVALTTLVGPDGDVHVFEPAPQDVQAVHHARLVVVNGLGLEGWLVRLIQASRTKARLVELAQGTKLVPLNSTESHSAAETHHHEHLESSSGTAVDADPRPGLAASYGPADPHAWQDVANARIYLNNLTRALCSVDSGGCAVYQQRNAKYAVELEELDAYIRAQIARVPLARRTVISGHASFAYFARAYGLRFLAPLGMSSDSDASAADIARLIRSIRGLGASAMFVESITDPRLLEQVSRETGMRLAGKLYADALSPKDGPAGSYVQMMRYNTDAIVSAILGEP